MIKLFVLASLLQVFLVMFEAKSWARFLFNFIAIFMMSLPHLAEADSSIWMNLKSAFAAQVWDQHKVELEISWDEENPDYFGGSSLTPDLFQISIGSKYKSHPDLLAYILCHELGHLLGGSPKKTNSTWASTEAQSDFFASAVCLRRLIEKDPKLSSFTIEDQSEFEILDSKCHDLKAVKREVSMCRRVGRIGHKMILTIYEFMNVPGFPKPKFVDQSKEISSGNKNQYPTLTCRMDVVLHGALCLNSKCAKPSCLRSITDRKP